MNVYHTKPTNLHWQVGDMELAACIPRFSGWLQTLVRHLTEVDHIWPCNWDSRDRVLASDEERPVGARLMPAPPAWWIINQRWKRNKCPHFLLAHLSCLFGLWGSGREFAVIKISFLSKQGLYRHFYTGSRDQASAQIASNQRFISQ